MSGEGPGKAFIFRLNDGQGPEVVRQVFLERGWQEFEEDEQADHEWNLWWRTSRFRTSDHDSLHAWQRLNHYPKSTTITRKDGLARNMKRMKGVHGASVFHFSPNAFNLPNDYTKFVAEYSRLRDKHPDKQHYWICKPADMSRGRGIFLFKDINELNYDCSAVVQTYISNPLLIAGYKFDLRIYVIVPSFHPLNIYIFQEGLCRFSTEKFDLGCLKNVFSHLTNTSINKHSPSYAVEKELVGPGCKWTLTQLRHYFRQSNIDDSQLFIKIQYIVILTLLIQANQVPKYTNCFELYGFDVMVDENMKPWLLEVNFSPALNTDAQVDFFVKKPLISDIIDMLGFTEEDKERGGPEFQRMKDNLQNAYTSYIPPTEGRRSSLGQAQNKRQSTALRKKNSQGRIANLSSSGQSGSTSTLVSNTPRSTATANLEGEGEDPLVTTPQPKPLSPGQKVVPLVPGCGLPSVQQPGKIGMRNAHQHTNDDSGRSSDSDSDSGGEKGDKEKSVKYDAKRDFSGRSRGQGPTPRTAYGYEHSLLYKGRKQSTYIRSFNRIPGKPREPTKRGVSKFSLASDSGLSSTSGSNSSEYAEQNTRTDDAIGLSSDQRQQLDITSGPKKTKLPGQSQTLHRDLDDELPHTLDKNSNIQSKYNKQKVERISEGFNKNSEQTQANSPNLKRRPMSFIAYKSQAEMRQNSRRNTDFRGTSRGFGETRFSQSLPSSRSRRQQNYDKPWRTSNSKPKEPTPKPGTPRHSASNPAPRVGDLFLAFPFNEATRQCARNGLDPRTVIKETQKMLKDRLAATVERPSGALFHRVDHPDKHHDDHNSILKTVGSSSARSSHRSLPVTLQSEKTMLSTATDPGVSPVRDKSGTRVRRPPVHPVGNRESRHEYHAELWAPIVLEVEQEPSAHF